MTITQEVALTFEERFAVALMRSGMTKKEFARFAGTTPKTLWRYATLRDDPNVGVVRLLAVASGFDYEWLRPKPEELPRLDSNQQPADWAFALLYDVLEEAESILTAVSR